MLVLEYAKNHDPEVLDDDPDLKDDPVYNTNFKVSKDGAFNKITSNCIINSHFNFFDFFIRNISWNFSSTVRPRILIILLKFVQLLVRNNNRSCIL